MAGMTTEPDHGEIPDEVLLQPADLANGTRTAMNQLVGFIQVHDGFTYTAYQSRQFDFQANGCGFTGSYLYEPSSETTDVEIIDITRHGNGILDHSVVKIDPRDSRTPMLITYSNPATGARMKNNTHGALRKILQITQPPVPQGRAI